MIKVINLVSLLAAPLIIQYKTTSPGVIITVILGTIAVIWAIWYSKRSGQEEFHKVEDSCGKK
jgi:K(+)-stimulated pyrophosphate-energized sodium pump